MMLKFYITFILFCYSQINFSQLNNNRLEILVPSYSFQRNDLTYEEILIEFYDKKKSTTRYDEFSLTMPLNDTSLSNNKEKLHGVYFELLGRSFLYAFGYEYQMINKKNSFGFGAGTSILRHNRVGIDYMNYYFGIHSFYEYGGRVGLRMETNIGVRFNPIMFTEKFDAISPADHPEKYILLPSNTLGIYYRDKRKKFHFLLGGSFIYGLYFLSDSYNFSFQPWFGVQCKYNFKIKN